MAESIRYVRVKDASTGNFLTDIIPFAVNLSNIILDKTVEIDDSTFTPNVNTLEDVISALVQKVESGTAAYIGSSNNGVPGQDVFSTPNVWFITEMRDIEED